MVKLRFWLQDYHGDEHPVAHMQTLGYTVLSAVPQSIADQRWFVVETLIEPLPEYLEVME